MKIFMKKRVLLIIFVLATVMPVFSQNASETIVSGNSLTRKFEWLLSNAESGKTYVIILDKDETLPQGQNLDYDGRIVTLILRGRGAMRKISNGVSAPAYASLFTVRSGVTLILDNNITLHGSRESEVQQSRRDQGQALVGVGNGAMLVMNDGSAVNDNRVGWGYYGAGVFVNGGTFTMKGGTISGGVAMYGGGVFVDGGTFVMNSGIISGNAGYRGGGVYIKDGTFTMTGGAISGNSTPEMGSAGVYIDESGVFTMTGGSISGNSAGIQLVHSYPRYVVVGGGVAVYGTFTMTGGSVSGNSANVGGGVLVGSTGTFNLNSPAAKSSISGNIGQENPQVFAEGNFRVNGLREGSY